MIKSCRLPDSAFDLMDEACASSRLQHDLKPEQFEKIKQAEKEKRAYISALEVRLTNPCACSMFIPLDPFLQRDDRRDADDALAEARKALADLENKSRQMEREQVEVKKHWETIASHRHKIARQREVLVQARSYVSSRFPTCSLFTSIGR
jgi:ATP-dependent Clp protease ATP-binding subunit ClpB